jgi:hypothetical protein
MGIYVDGADEIDPGMAMIKGGGGALTREKDRRRGGRYLRLHLRCVETGSGDGQVPAAG